MWRLNNDANAATKPVRAMLKYSILLTRPVRVMCVALLVMGCVAFISGCGFQLRGSVELPQNLQQMALAGIPQTGVLAVDIRNALERAGGNLVDTASAADSIIVITRDSVEQTVLSVNSSGQASEYELHYQLGYRLEANDGRVLVPAQTISLFRQYEYNPATVLAKSDQQAELTQQMRRSAVNQMLQQLAASARQVPAMSNSPDPTHAPAP